MHSRGTATKGDAEADLRAQALVLDGGDAKDDHLALSVAMDRERPSLHVKIDSDGRATAKLSASMSFDRAHGAVPYEIEGRFANLAPLAPFASKVRGLVGFDLSKLEVALSSQGTLLGVVSSVTQDGAIHFEPHPSRTAAVEGKADLQALHVRWARGDTAIATPAVTWHGDFHVTGARRELKSHVDLEALSLGLGNRQVDLAGISDDTSAVVIGDLSDPETELSQHATVRTVQQDAVAAYPVGDVAFTLTALRDPEGLIHVAEMKLVNGAAGTTLDLSGGIELGGGRHRLSLTADVLQDLAPLSSTPERFTGRGKVAFTAKVESPDLLHFRTKLDVKVEDVHAKIPRAGIEVEAANGEVPMTATFELGRNGLEFPRDERLNPYSMLRFADQHPLLSRTGFISIASIKTRFASIAPLVGNLEVSQNLFSMRQFEMGIRGGKVTGQCRARLEGYKVDGGAPRARDRGAVLARRTVRRKYRDDDRGCRPHHRGARRDPADRPPAPARPPRHGGPDAGRPGDEPHSHRARVWLSRSAASGLRPRFRERQAGARGPRTARQHRRNSRNPDGAHRRQVHRAHPRHEGPAMKRALFFAALTLAGCFKPPEIVMVDRATALEQQAAGSFPELEHKLDRAGIEPRPVPLTPEQLETLGVRPAALVDGAEITDADRLDGLLVQQCVGEGLDGMVVDTRDACHGGADPDEVAALVDRVNRARRQLWRWMHEQRSGTSVDDLRRGWRQAHLAGVVCGGWIESDAGKWQRKAC